MWEQGIVLGSTVHEGYTAKARGWDQLTRQQDPRPTHDTLSQHPHIPKQLDDTLPASVVRGVCKRARRKDRLPTTRLPLTWVHAANIDASP